jgi:hypothetical protein
MIDYLASLPTPSPLFDRFKTSTWQKLGLNSFLWVEGKPMYIKEAKDGTHSKKYKGK